MRVDTSLMALALTCLGSTGCLDLGAGRVPDLPSDEPEPIESMFDGAVGGDGAEVVVLMKDIAFRPMLIEVKVGTTVVFRSADPGTFHQVRQGKPRQSDAPDWESTKLQNGDEWRITFDEAGEIVYFCANHSTQMRNARIVVVP